MKRLPKEIARQLDSLDDDELIYWLYLKYGCEEQVWDEITKEEYDRDCPHQYGDEEPITKEMLNNILKELFSTYQYKREPIGIGLLDRLKGKEPSEYKYYKSNRTEWVLIVSEPLANYIKKRGLQCRTKTI